VGPGFKSLIRHHRIKDLAVDGIAALCWGNPGVTSQQNCPDRAAHRIHCLHRLSSLSCTGAFVPAARLGIGFGPLRCAVLSMNGIVIGGLVTTLNPGETLAPGDAMASDPTILEWWRRDGLYAPTSSISVA
jgi:hypothetical protein